MDLNPLIPSVEGEALQSMPVGEAEGPQAMSQPWFQPCICGCATRSESSARGCRPEGSTAADRSSETGTPPAGACCLENTIGAVRD